MVVLGCSAGGLDALGLFFRSLPVDFKAGFIVASHFPATSESHLVEILSHCTGIPVEWAQDQLAIAAGTVYVLPPGHLFAVEKGRFVMREKVFEVHPHLLVDELLESLAADIGGRAVAVILSGSGCDGAMGARAVKEAGGLVLVQEPDSARFGGMPESTILTGVADCILSPAGLATELARITGHRLTRPLPQSFVPSESLHNSMRKLVGLLKRHTGLDLSAYKQESVSRRIERRMGIVKISDFESYVAELQKNPAECESLSQDMLISVTRFFRDPGAFQQLRDSVLPSMIRESNGRPLRLWVPGCATGEEAYTIAMLLEEALQECDEAGQACKIFATDLDRRALDIAGQGLYPASIAANIPAPLLEKYFTQQGDHFLICRNIRNNLIFAKHNILKDPPFTRLDLISCRNLLIYLQAPAQQHVLSILHFGLRPGGVLMLGLSEALGDLQGEFTPLDSAQHIFQKTKASQLPPGTSGQFGVMLPSSPMIHEHQPVALALPTRSSPRIIEAFTNRILMRLGRTCFVLDHNLEILYSFGNPGKYLVFAEGRSTLKLENLLPRPISITLSAAAGKVLSDGKTFQYGPILVGEGPEAFSVSVLVEAFHPEKEDQVFLLVFIEEIAKTAQVEQVGFKLKDSILRISELEDELRGSKLRLKVTVEELEASNEELQTSNEELQSSNEELQSSNEELESVNEELQNLNSEHQAKIVELTKAHEDLDNFISCADIATIFLDSGLLIRRFTPAAAARTGLMPHDVGREISAFSHPLLIEAARAATLILAGGTPRIESSFPGEKGDTMLMRAVPFIRKDGTRTGAAVTFIQINSPAS